MVGRAVKKFGRREVKIFGRLKFLGNFRVSAASAAEIGSA